MSSERLFHIATRDDWNAARASGSYTTSTVGRTLDDEGFIHACRRDQVSGVFSRYYKNVREPLVLLTITPERLMQAEVREEVVGDETYPHIYGPIPRGAVVSAVPLNRRGGTESLLSLFMREMVKRMAIAIVVMVVITVVLLIAIQLKG